MLEDGMFSIKFIILTLLLSFSQWTLALKSDSDQPVTIDSNTATYDDEKGVSIYTGNVVTIQGSLHIQSDKLVVYLTEGHIDKMVFTGKPTKFRQRPNIGKEEIFGEGLTGEYYPDKDKLILIKEAVVSQGNNRSASELITYDSKNSVIKAGEHTSDSKRVHSIFKPRKKSNSAPIKKTQPSAKKELDSIVESLTTTEESE
jgi:lipopolysaccharide export system protein LptA